MKKKNWEKEFDDLFTAPPINWFGWKPEGVKVDEVKSFIHQTISKEVKEAEQKGRKEVEKDRILAKQCLEFQGFGCKNQDCKNEVCPLNKKLREEE